MLFLSLPIFAKLIILFIVCNFVVFNIILFFRNKY